MTAHAHVEFIVLPHWEIRPPAPETDIPPKSHYPDTELTSHSPMILIPSAKLGSDEYLFDTSLVLLKQDQNSRSLTQEARALPIRPRRR